MRVLAIMIGLGVLTANLAPADEPPAAWTEFLEPGAALTPADVPLTWSPTENIAWQAAIPGYGQSSPVVWDGRIYVTAVEGDMKETCHVAAYRLGDGEQLWKHSFDSSERVKSDAYVSRAAPTPVVDADGVYAFFESGDILALDHAGQERWRRSLTKEYGAVEAQHGLAASLAQHDDAIFALVDHNGPSYILALEKKTGENRWKTERASRISWSSPSINTIDGQPQLVVSAAGSLDGYDPTNGKRLWTFDDVGGNTVTTPKDRGDGLFLVGASGGERGENAELAPRSNAAFRIVRDAEAENGWRVARVWQAEKALSSFSSPIMHQGRAYWVNRSGVLFCFDEAGEPLFNHRLDESCWATPLAVGDRIYFFGRRGKTTVIKAAPEFEKLATNVLWNSEAGADPFAGSVLYGAAAVPGSLLLRTGDTLYCVRTKNE